MIKCKIFYPCPIFFKSPYNFVGSSFDTKSAIYKLELMFTAKIMSKFFLT